MSETVTAKMVYLLKERGYDRMTETQSLYSKASKFIKKSFEKYFFAD